MKEDQIKNMKNILTDIIKLTKESLDKENINEYIEEIKRVILFNLRIQPTKLIKSIKELFFFYYVIDTKINIENKDIKFKAIDNIGAFLLDIKSYTYDEFMEKSLNTFDLYGYGLCLLYSLRYCDIYLSDNLAEELYKLALDIADLNVFTRLTIEKAQEKFKSILINNKILNL